MILRTLLVLSCVTILSLAEDLLSCDAKSSAASGYHCDKTASKINCNTFAILFTNSYYSSLSNLSLHLGINRVVLSEANALPPVTEILPLNQPLLIPIQCKCVAGFYGAELTKTTIRGESFYGIAKSLEGLTTCKAIRDKNPNFSPRILLKEKLKLVVPLRCACPTAAEKQRRIVNFLSYPVREGDAIAALAIKFNTTPESIVAANKRPELAGSSSSTLLIPTEEGNPKPRPNQPKLATRIPPKKRKRSSKMRMMGIFIAVSVIAFAAAAAIAAACVFIRLKRKKKEKPCKDEKGDLELQELGLSVRTASEKKLSFERSEDQQITDHTPKKKLCICTFTIDELNRATEDFSPSNHIEGSVFHGRLNGKNLAIKQTDTCNIWKIDLSLFVDAIHHHPNIIRLLGTCLTDSPAESSFLIFEYARNGSLKDWLHGGLAMKNQFIASCYCFLTWDQRLKICLGVASALQFMHQIMNPPYIHRNIKSRNIFLDEEFNAKIGNFGMANCSSAEDESQLSWNRGYLAPEHNQSSVSTSVDIFAFGVVLLEVLSGETPITRENGKGEAKVRLSEKIKMILSSENADELREWIDGAVGENYPFDAAVTLANLARSCVEDDPSLRPNAGEVVEKLSRLVEELSQGGGGEQFPMCESTGKPLVKAAASTM